MPKSQEDASALAFVPRLTVEKLRAWVCLPARHSSKKTRIKARLPFPQPPQLVMPTLSCPHIAVASHSSSALLTTGVIPPSQTRSSSASTSAVHLRGGGRKKVRPLADDERVPKWTWFFAGGVGPPATGKQLRKWKAREQAVKERRKAQQAAAGGLFPALKALFKGQPKNKSSWDKSSKSKPKTEMSGGNGAAAETAEPATGDAAGADAAAAEG